ncbi:MAG: hypothetical protein MUE60_01765 [Candidatus Eisenbacteria bacterium]|nr:hypothetical protein [Candidatus Eisenbacteria bacterium]
MAGMKGLDRTIIYWGVAFSIVIPLLWPIGFSTEVTSQVRDIHRFIEQMPESSAVLMSFDYEPATIAELDPMAAAFLKHLFQRRARVMGMTLLPGGVGLAENLLRQEAAIAGMEYGRNWLFLGYIPDGTAAMLRMGEDVAMVFPTDQYGTALDSFPMMRGVKSYRNMGLVICLSSTAMPQLWAQYAHDRYGAAVAVGATAVEAVRLYPYHDSGQLVGFLGGLKGAAEYETLIQTPGDGIRGMDAQTISHLFIVMMVVLGNIGYAATKWRGRAGASTGRNHAPVA